MDFLSNDNVRADDNIRIEAQAYIQSQYSASPAICTLLADFRSKIQCDVDFFVFLRKLMDVDTATGEGLDNLGRIVDMSRTLEMDDGTLVLLNDEQYRRLLKYKMLANIGDATADTINKMLAILYEGADNAPKLFTVIQEEKNGDEYYNGKPMHVRWLINGKLDDIELALFRKGGLLCLGAGVGYDMVAVDAGSTFGFLGQELQPFNQGIFWDGSYIDV